MYMYYRKICSMLIIALFKFALYHQRRGVTRAYMRRGETTPSARQAARGATEFNKNDYIVKSVVQFRRDVNKDLTPKDQDKDKDLTPKDQDKDKDLTPNEKDKNHL